MHRGHSIVAPASSAQAWIPAFTGRYDDAELDLLLRFARARTLYVDVGACFGFWTVPLAIHARRVGGHVLAFEPIPGNRRYLERNLERNAVRHVVTVIGAALGRHGGTVRLRPESGGLGNAAVVEDAREGDVDVPVFALDEVELPPALAATPVSIAKLDVEGFEMDVLAGMERRIALEHPVILGEFNPIWSRRRGISADEPARWASRHGYAARRLARRREHPWTDRYRIVPDADDGPPAEGDAVLLQPTSAG
jgi:FkbM family methyltransferase